MNNPGYRKYTLAVHVLARPRSSASPHTNPHFPGNPVVAGTNPSLIGSLREQITAREATLRSFVSSKKRDTRP